MAQIFRAVTHPEGYRGVADFDIKGSQIFRAVTHPKGYRGVADFDIK